MRRTLLPALPLLLLVAACGGFEPEAPPAADAPAGERVESPALGIAVAHLPEGLAVAANQGTELVLKPAGERPGTLRVEVAPPSRAGVNLVQAINDHKAAVEAQPEGEYRGQVELMGPLGTAYASRGRYTAEGGPIEELIVFTIHPAGDRLLSLIYSYPVPDDTEARRDELMTLLGEIEGLGTPAEEAAPAAEPAAAP